MKPIIRQILIVAAAIAIVAALFDALRFVDVQMYWPALLLFAGISMTVGWAMQDG